MKDNVIIVVAFFGLMAIIAALYMMPLNYEGHCIANGLQYIDVARYGAQCYGDFDANLCPLPVSLQCNFKGQMSLIMLNRIRDR